jgi:uncharacterized damage-inducible protein DinB/glutaredoxin
LEEFLTSNGVQYEHHDLATDEPARDYLRLRGIKSLPVTIVDDEEVIIGYYPKKLIPALNLRVKVDLSSKTGWLSEKYDVMFSATIRATHQLSQSQLDQQVPWRPWSLRDTIIHILSFPELAWLSHSHGSMSTEDMRASDERLKDVTAVADIVGYGDGVRRKIINFLSSSDIASFDRVVPAHYGGEVTVLELLNIILSHSTHHLKQVYWHMENNLTISLQEPATDQDFEGIVTPTALI